MERYDAGRLADTVREVIAEATAQLRAYVSEQYREILGETFDPEALADPDAAAEQIRRLRDHLRDQ